MRIRKRARIFSSLSLSHASIAPCARETLQTHVCELNRSPWDVMAFAPQSDFSYPVEYQVAIENNDMGNRVGGESVNTVESVSSMNEKWQEEVKVEDEDEDEEEDKSERRFSLLSDVDKEKKNGLKREEGLVTCNKTDGKGWKCRREAKEGHSLCDHHLTQLRSYHYNYTQSSRKSDDTKAVASSRRRNRGSRESKLANPSDFYYYSGFGPLWGKKRAGEREANSSGRATTSSHVDLDLDLDNDDDDDDDDDNGGEDNKKRVRKPIKARSLKSLL